MRTTNTLYAIGSADSSANTVLINDEELAQITEQSNDFQQRLLTAQEVANMRNQLYPLTAVVETLPPLPIQLNPPPLPPLPDLNLLDNKLKDVIDVTYGRKIHKPRNSTTAIALKLDIILDDIIF